MTRDKRWFFNFTAWVKRRGPRKSAGYGRSVKYLFSLTRRPCSDRSWRIPSALRAVPSSRTRPRVSAPHAAAGWIPRVRDNRPYHGQAAGTYIPLSSLLQESFSSWPVQQPFSRQSLSLLCHCTRLPMPARWSVPQHRIVPVRPGMSRQPPRHPGNRIPLPVQWSPAPESIPQRSCPRCFGHLRVPVLS
jgi:hypothetical protein